MRKSQTQFHFSSRKGFLTLLTLSFFLHGCMGGGSSYSGQPWQPRSGTTRPAEASPNDLSSAKAVVQSVEAEALPSEPIPAQPQVAPVKVAILLPLSGENQKLGQSMLNAAQMAMFDVGFDSFELIPKDTGGTAEGAKLAAHSAIQEGAKLILGPVFSHSVKAAHEVARTANINMIPFTTDWTLASGDTFLIGFLPFDQVQRVVSFASQKGYKRIGVLSPNDSYGNGVVAAYQTAARQTNLPSARIERFMAEGQDVSNLIRTFTDYDQRKASQDQLGAPFDAVLMPVGGTLARQTSSLLSHYELPPQTIKRLGTGLLDDESLATERNLDGAWFAAPAPNARLKFERRYQSTYGEEPVRIASLAYDATALAAILARSGLQSNNAPAFDRTSITNPNGFSGVDGIFRFRTDGISERGLAILEYRNGRIVTIDEAPKTFQAQSF